MLKIRYKLKKKGTTGFNALYVIIPMVVIFLLWGLFQTYGADITQDIRDDQTSGTYAYNISGFSLEAQNTLAEKQETTSKVVIAGIIIAVLLGVFGGYIYGKMR